MGAMALELLELRVSGEAHSRKRSSLGMPWTPFRRVTQPGWTSAENRLGQVSGRSIGDCGVFCVCFFVGGRGGERERQTEIETERDRETETESDRDRERQGDRDRVRQRQSEREKQRDPDDDNTLAHKDKDSRTNRLIYIYSYVTNMSL